MVQCEANNSDATFDVLSAKSQATHFKRNIQNYCVFLAHIEAPSNRIRHGTWLSFILWFKFVRNQFWGQSDHFISQQIISCFSPMFSPFFRRPSQFSKICLHFFLRALFPFKIITLQIFCYLVHWNRYWLSLDSFLANDRWVRAVATQIIDRQFAQSQFKFNIHKNEFYEAENRHKNNIKTDDLAKKVTQPKRNRQNARNFGCSRISWEMLNLCFIKQISIEFVFSFKNRKWITKSWNYIKITNKSSTEWHNEWSFWGVEYVCVFFFKNRLCLWLTIK